MIYSGRINQISITYIKLQNLRILEKYEFHDFETILPAKFHINGSWRISHSCKKCKKKITTGADEPQISLNEKNYIRLPYVTSKNFNVEFLQKLSQWFDAVLINENNQVKVIPSKLKNEKMVLGLTLFQYECHNCGLVYLAHYDRGYGETKERGGEIPTPDIIIIHDIIALEEFKIENVLLPKETI